MEQRYRDAFDLYDKKNDGTISHEDFSTLIRALGKTPTESQLKDLVAQADPQKSGRVKFPNVLQILEKKLDPITSEQLKAGFQVCDEEHTGFVSAAELREMLTTMGDTLSAEEADKLLKMVPKEGDKIRIDGFAQMMTTF